MKEVSTKTYSLEIPNEWEMQSTDDGLVSIYDPSGKGAITISSYLSDAEILDVVSELKKFAHKDILVHKEKTADQEIALAEYENLNNGDVIFTYSVAVGRSTNLLLASYHCKKSDMSLKELNIAKKIFETIILKNA